MANKTIHELTPATTVGSGYEFAIYDTDNNTTKKATVSDILSTEDLLYADDTATPTGEVDFSSQDTSLSPSSSVSVDLLSGDDSWSARFVKISQMFKNIRFLLGKLGTTDISSIGNGTVTGALSTLNSKMTTPENLTIVPSSSSYTIDKGFAFRVGKIVVIGIVMSSTGQIASGQALFRLDYATNQSVVPAASQTGSASYSWPISIIFSGTSTVTQTLQSGGHVYFTSGATISAGTNLYISGTFICQ